MYDYLIRSYVERMTEDDIDSFAKKNGLTLSQEEIAVIKSYIKKDWRTIVYGNPRAIFDEAKEKLNPLTYQKILELYCYFKEKYKNYL